MDRAQHPGDGASLPEHPGDTESVEIVLLFEEEFREGNKLFRHHRIHAMENGRRRVTHVMGYAVLEGGRISLINFVSHSEFPQ